MKNFFETFSGLLDPVMLGPMLLSWGGKLVAAALIVIAGNLRPNGSPVFIFITVP